MRRHTYMKQVQAIMAAALPESIEQAQIAQLTAIASRKPSKDNNSQPAPRSQHSRSKYMPHQGRQECARRLLPNYDRERRLQAFIDAIPDDARSSLDALI